MPWMSRDHVLIHSRCCVTELWSCGASDERLRLQGRKPQEGVNSRFWTKDGHLFTTPQERVVVTGPDKTDRAPDFLGAVSRWQ